MCRAYPWSGQYYSQKPGNVKWERVCIPKNADGFGVRDTLTQNQVALGRYVWVIATNKDNMWIHWIHEAYGKDDEWWDYKPTQQCNWYWEIICLAKD